MGRVVFLRFWAFFRVWKFENWSFQWLSFLKIMIHNATLWSQTVTTYKWTGTTIHITMLFYDSQWMATVMDNITVNGVKEGTLHHCRQNHVIYYNTLPNRASIASFSEFRLPVCLVAHSWWWSQKTVIIIKQYLYFTSPSRSSIAASKHTWTQQNWSTWATTALISSH